MLDRKIEIRGKSRLVRHKWRAHREDLHLTSTLLKEGTNQPAGKALSGMAADYNELGERGREHAEVIRSRVEKRGNQAERAASTAAAVAAAGRKRRGADAIVASSDPLITELRSGTRSVPRPRVTEPPKTVSLVGVVYVHIRLASERELLLFHLSTAHQLRFHNLTLPPTRTIIPYISYPIQQAPERRRADAELTVQGWSPAMKEDIESILGKEALGAAASTVAAIDAENTRAIIASLEALRLNTQSSMGRISYNTVLAAAAGAGEHTYNPAERCHPSSRCPAAPPQDAALSLAARAPSLGVRGAATFSAAHRRMHNTDHSVPPPEALEKGRYL